MFYNFMILSFAFLRHSLKLQYDVNGCLLKIDAMIVIVMQSKF